MSTNIDKPTVLCFSRSYLSELIPRLERHSKGMVFLHIVQTITEKHKVESNGGKVVLCLEETVKLGLKGPSKPWVEPDDFRSKTGLAWDPIALDRHLVQFAEKTRNTIARTIFLEFENLFSKYEINSVLSEPVALFPTHVLLYLCKRHGAAPLLWANSYFPDYL